METKVQIEIYLDGGLFGTRNWPVVPAVGDHLFINKGKEQVKVTGRVFGANSGSEEIVCRQLVVAITCVRVKGS
jgi:hypothetical protein